MKNLLLNLPAETDLAAILAVPAPAPLLPPLGTPFWRERLARPPLRRIPATLRHAAREEAEHPLPPLTDALYADYHTTGIRQRFEAVYFERRRRLARALFCALADGPESELVPSAVRKLEEIFDEVAWELPAHVSSPDGKDPTVIGLFAAETAHLMAQCACLLGDALPDDLRHRIRARLETQITGAYLTRGEELLWPRETDNWNAVCHQGILGAALLLEDNPNRLARLLHAAAPRLARFLDGFAADGGCSEGPTYWAYGFGAFMALNEQLEWRTGGRLSLVAGQEERMRAVARYGVTVTLAGGRVVNFADSQETPLEAHAPLLAYLGRRLNEPACLELAQVLYAGIEEHGMDMNSARCDVFYLERLLRHCPEGGPPTALLRRFNALPDLQVFVARGAGSHGVYWEFAAKGGHNAEHHNHNDCGAYMVHLDGVPAIVEMGRPEYTSETFGPKRYECNATRSRGHSVPVINGCEQAEGAEHAARVLRVTDSDGRVEIVLDLTRCYPQAAGCTSCVRTFVFEPGQLRVEDTVQLAAAGEVETAVILPDREEQRVRIEPSAGTVLAATEVLHYRSPENPDAAVRRLVLKSPEPSTNISLAYTVRNLMLKTSFSKPVPGAGVTPASGNAPDDDARLWDREPSLWDEAGNYRLVRPLSPVFGWEGPSGGAFGKYYSAEPGWKFTEGIDLARPGALVATTGPDFTGPLGEGINITNERVFSSFWGTPERMVFSIGKTDVYNRAAMNWTSSMKPVGQILVFADNFAGAAQPEVSTTIHNGVHRLALAQGAAAAELQLLLTDKETNVFAIKASATGLTKPLSVRLSRHADTLGDLPDPESGHDGEFFWIHQSFAGDKTFPQGFDYYLVAKIGGATAAMQTAVMQPGLGAPVPFRDDAAPGSAATATLAPERKLEVVIYATVVTRAETDEPLVEAKRRLNDAEKAGFDTLVDRNEEWYRELYERREHGRIFTGNFDDAKDVSLPFIFQSRYLSRHTYHSNPDPTRFEGDGNYNVMECDEVFWSGLQCFNEELFTGDYVAARDETVADYYVKLFNLWRSAWEAHADSEGMPGMYILRGYVPPIKADVYNSPDPFAMDGCDWATMIWAFKCVWDAYDYGGHGVDFLRDSVYPSLRGMADFFAARVTLGADGCYHIEPSQVREHAIGRDAVDCVGAINWAFKTAIAAAEQLGVDADRRRIWRERLNMMTPYTIMADQEGEPVWASIIKDGVPIGSGGTAEFIVNLTDEINLESPLELRRIAIRSNRSGYGGSPLSRLVDCLLGENPDKLCMGTNPMWIWMFAHPAWMLFYAQKSGHGDFARDLALRTRPQKAIACWLEPERLLNSRSGTLFFFPCVPSNFDVAFRDFQARGGFCVSAEWRNGTVTHAEITARRDGTCLVMNPWPGRPLGILELPDNTPVKFTLTNDKIKFEAQAGRTYLITVNQLPGTTKT